MMRTNIFFSCVAVFLALSGEILNAQTLEDLLNQKLGQEPKTEYTHATFKATRIISGHSVETTDKGDLVFIVQHRFGRLNSGFYNFFGLDNANTRIGLDYGPLDRLSIGAGRSTYQKTFDGYLKYKILRQQSGIRNVPVTISLVAASDINTMESNDPEKNYSFVNRLSYTSQLLISRKFGPRFSLQLSPSYLHRNLVKTRTDQNDVFAIGGGARIKITSRVSLNGEYFYLLPGQTADDFNNSFSLGFDLESGGHVFQLHFTNSISMIERGFIAGTDGKWSEGDIHFGFNISRNFSLQRPAYLD